MDSYVELFRASNSIEANAFKGLLEQQAIPVRLLGEALGGAAGELPMDTQQIRVLVQQCHLPAAKGLLQQYQQNIAPWQCSCGEQNDGHFELCWRCGSEPVT
ncbi:DUF2007 domain-containing protein [uncultured Ferrimonas sp.]|uniref:putative signal transducing protein n=1 Tax=uncultured Ferrimonas sp. TaxID=432640 RepID=UPI00262BC915|nr:DUF2007 domain-containing protein [uncultured Ferrimonas sp.]